MWLRLLAMQLPHDAVAVEHHPRFQQRRQRQLARLAEHLARLAVRQLVDADDLDGEIVLAAGFIGLVDDRLRGRVEIGGAVA